MIVADEIATWPRDIAFERWLGEHLPPLDEAKIAPRVDIRNTTAIVRDLPDNPPPHPFNAVAEAIGLELAHRQSGGGGGDREAFGWQIRQMVGGGRRFGKTATMQRLIG